MNDLFALYDAYANEFTLKRKIFESQPIFKEQITKKCILDGVERLFDHEDDNNYQVVGTTKVYILHWTNRNHPKDDFYLECYLTPCHLLSRDGIIEREGLKLVSLIVPKYLMRQGIAFEILAFFESFSIAHDIPFVIYPVISKEFVSVLRKRLAFDNTYFSQCYGLRWFYSTSKYKEKELRNQCAASASFSRFATFRDAVENCEDNASIS